MNDLQVKPNFSRIHESQDQKRLSVEELPSFESLKKKEIQRLRQVEKDIQKFLKAKNRTVQQEENLHQKIDALREKVLALRQEVAGQDAEIQEKIKGLKNTPSLRTTEPEGPVSAVSEQPELELAEVPIKKKAVDGVILRSDTSNFEQEKEINKNFDDKSFESAPLTSDDSDQDIADKQTGLRINSFEVPKKNQEKEHELTDSAQTSETEEEIADLEKEKRQLEKRLEDNSFTLFGLRVNSESSGAVLKQQDVAKKESTETLSSSAGKNKKYIKNLLQSKKDVSEEEVVQSHEFDADGMKEAGKKSSVHEKLHSLNAPGFDMSRAKGSGLSNKGLKRKGKNVHFGKKGGREVENILENLAFLLESGLEFSSALSSLERNIRSKKVAQVFVEVSRKVRQGKPFWESIADEGFISLDRIPLIKIGEETGTLIDKIKLVVEEKRQRDRNKSNLKSLLFYPALVFTLTLVITTLMGIFVLPRLAEIFSGLDADLPAITRLLINMGTWMEAHGFVALPIFFFLMALGFYFVFFNKKTNFIGQNIVLGVPVIRDLVKNSQVSTFCSGVSVMIASGIPIYKSLGLIEDALVYYRYKRLLYFLRLGIAEGKSFNETFRERQAMVDKLIPYEVQDIIVAGEKSGNLSKVLRTVSERVDAQSETISKNLTNLLEPVLLIIIWAAVVFLAVAILLPIYNLVGNFSV